NVAKKSHSSTAVPAASAKFCRATAISESPSPKNYNLLTLWHIGGEGEAIFPHLHHKYVPS
ncbi:MAG: hypothetical protein Q4F39_06555, partial [Bacteroidia bacterium]|nr:hypothetical protein [Bacteroidia bacterium]